MSRPVTLISAIVFLAVAMVHVVRIFTRFQVVIGSHHIPLWVSYFGVVIPLLLAISLLRESKAA
jgi:hypothetical protein